MPSLRAVVVVTVGLVLASGARSAADPSPRPPAAPGDRRAPAALGRGGRPEAGDMDARADAKRDEAMVKLRKVLEGVTDPQTHAELTFRLAELTWGKSRSLALTAMRRWDEALEAWTAGGRAGPEPRLEDQPGHAEGERRRRDALDLYERLLAEHPDYPRRDEVLYDLGTAVYEGGDRARGVELLWTLLSQSPGSDFAADAWLALGEHFFAANELAPAQHAYAEAARTDSSGRPAKPRVYSYALYKLAWCDFNDQQYERALERFRRVVAYAKGQPAGDGAGALGERDRVQLVREALADMVRVYVRLERFEDAFDWYTGELGVEAAHDHLRRLAQAFGAAGKSLLEIRTYDELDRRWPDAPTAPQNQAAVVTAWATLGRPAEVRREVRRLIDRYSPDGAWARANASRPGVLDEAFAKVEETLATLVTEQHRAAQQTKLVEGYQLARDLYREYLGRFAGSPSGYRFRFLYADILFELGEYEPAADQYRAVVAAGADRELARPAAHAAVVALQKVVAGVKDDARTRLDDRRAGRVKGAVAATDGGFDLAAQWPAAAVPLAPAEQKLADACDAFVAVAGDDPEAIKVLLEGARVYWRRHHLDEANARFAAVVRRWPGDPLARVAARALLGTLVARSDWEHAAAWARELRDDRALSADRAFAGEVQGLLEAATFNEIHEVIEARGDDAATAARYLAFVAEWPNSRLAPVALYDAALAHERLRALDAAAAVLARLLDRAPATVDAGATPAGAPRVPDPVELRERALFLWATLEERLARLDRAAALYERYARELPSGPRRPEALYQAGVLREGTGELDYALAALLRHAADYPRRDDARAVLWRVGLLYEKKHDHTAAERHFAAWAKTARDPADAVCAEARVLSARLAAGRTREARAQASLVLAGAGRLVAGDRQKGCVLEAAALAAFTVIEADYESYLALGLEGSERELEQRVARKLKALKELQARYTEVLQLGAGTYGIAALHHVGSLYADLARRISAQKCPRRLTDEQCGMYEAALADKSAALEDKAVEAWEKAVAKGCELGLYGSWLARTQDELAKLKPRRFAERRRVPLPGPDGAFGAPLTHDGTDATGVAAALGSARSSVRQDAPGEAVAILERALATKPDDTTVLVALATALRLAGRAEAAAERARRVIGLDPGNARALLALGLAHADLGQLELAEAHLHGALSAAPRDPEVRVGLALVAARRGDDARALAELEEALALDPKHAVASAGVGAIALANRDYDRAARAFGAALEGGLATCATTSGQGFALEGRKQGAEAVAALERARATCRDAGDLELALGDVCEVVLRDHACALRHYEAHVSAHADLPPAHRVFGLIRSLEELVAAGGVDSTPGR